LNEHSASLRRSGAIRCAFGVAAALAVVTLFTSLLHAQISEEDKKKRDAFLRAREEMHTLPSPTPAESASKAKPKPATKKKRKSPAAEPTKTPAGKKSDTADDDDGDATAKPKRATPISTATPKKAQPAGDDEDEPVRRRPSVPPPARPDDSTPAPRFAPPAPSTNQPPPDITIQKSGIEQEQGYEPPPPPPRRSFWARLFGGARERTYRYLSRDVIDAIRRAPVQRSRWKFIIVHNSGTRQGNARAFDYYHRNVRHMQNGLAYHFVVGNGTSSGNGQVEVGDRWRRQINGGHVHSDYLNNISLGICLVGDFNRDHPTRAQLEATEELIGYLRERCGKADGRPIPVRPHREMNPPRWATDCPGDAFPYQWFARF
jgi:hypothetical protein